MTKWRDILPVHPAADLFPMMKPMELIALGDDIERNGLKVPVVILSEGSNLFLFDGRNRLDAMGANGCDVMKMKESPWVKYGIR